MEMDFDSNNSQVIDQELGLRLAGNKPDLAEDLLKMLVDDLPQMQSTISAAYANKDNATVSKLTHKLNGGAAYCGVPRLKSAAATLESNLKTHAFEPETIDKLVKALFFEIEQVLACYEKSYQS